MSTALIRGRDARSRLPAPLQVAAGRQHSAETILRMWREGKSAHTLRGYGHDLEDFSHYFSRALGISPPMKIDEALGRLFKQSSPSAHEIVLGFRHYLASANLAPASINRHMACLRSLSKLGRMLGLQSYVLEIPGVKAEKRRQTAGPTVADVRRLLEATRGDSEEETRGYAMVLVFYACGLRVSELCGLNLQDTDLTKGNTWILGKGRRERELVPLPASVIEAIQRYLKYRGTQAGPLFLTKGNRGKHRDGRLETRSVLRIVRELGQRIGLHVWCHGIRHASITTAIDAAAAAGMGLHKVLAHSRHAAITTLIGYYDDQDRDKTQRTLADLVAQSVLPTAENGHHADELVTLNKV